jgi:hypothetical protein
MSTQPHIKAPRRAWFGLAVLALPCMITVMDLTVLNLAVPHLSEALKPDQPVALDHRHRLHAGWLMAPRRLGTVWPTQTAADWRCRVRRRVLLAAFSTSA